MKTDSEENYKDYSEKNLINGIDSGKIRITKDLTIKLIKKRLPEKVVNMHGSPNNKDDNFGKCPSCGLLICDMWNNKYCGDCGQRLDWSEKE